MAELHTDMPLCQKVEVVLVLLTEKCIPTEPAWETIVENVLVYNMLQVAGTQQVRHMC